MIEEIKMFCGTCDNCGDTWENGDGIMAFIEKDHVRYSMQESDWHIADDGKTYCRNCYDFADDDKLMIKPNSKPADKKASLSKRKEYSRRARRNVQRT